MPQRGGGVVNNKMNIKIINNYKTDENTYIVYDENGIGFVIDPGNSHEEIIKFCQNSGIIIDKIILTHCHYDHIEYLEQLRENTKADLICSKNCSKNIQNERINLSIYGLGKEIKAKEAQIILNDNDKIKIGDMEVLCIYTPGHTNCSACFIVENNVFSGDTLSLRNCGRWDLPTGDENTLINSIKEKLYTLNEEYIVYPGHGSKTTIGYEKKYNLYVR